MSKRTDVLLDQIKRACKLTGAQWAVVYRPGVAGWDIALEYKLNKSKRKALDDYMAKKGVDKWIEAISKTGKSRNKSIKELVNDLGCGRIYGFGTRNGAALLVGADEMDKMGKGLFENLSLNIHNGVGDAALEQMIEEEDRYLERFGLLSELASVSVKGVGVKEIIEWLERNLSRGFDADDVKVFRLERTENMLCEVGKPKQEEFMQLPLDATLEGAVIRIGQPIRIDNIAKQSKYSSVNPDVQSKLVAPMWFWGEVIGVISLESLKAENFSDRDEELMVVIASHTAGILENDRLQNQTQTSIHNLRQINAIIGQVLGLNTASDVASAAATVMAERFGYELVMVMLLDEALDEFVAEGLGGEGAQDFPTGLRYASHFGIPGEVMRSGDSVFLPDVEASSSYIKIPDWEPGSQMCVPLRDGENIFGLISVEYQVKNAVAKSDLAILESLAGALSNVLVDTRRYEELQITANQLEVVRETALDISANLDLDVLMKRVVNRVRELLDARGAELGLVDEDEQVVRILVSENPWKDFSGYTFPLMQGVAGRIAAVGEPVIVPDFQQWAGDPEEGRRSSFTTVAGVPLKLSGEVIGTLVVQDDRVERSFTQEDMKVLELLSPQLTIFIRNARLYQELEERIEAQHLAESRLIQSAKLAAVGEMAAGVAHELNNPLTTVTGFAELILETMPKDSPEYEDMTLILQEAHRVRSVVRQLLDFTRKSEILRVHLDINEVLSAVLGLVSHQAQTSKVEVRIAFWDGLPMVRVDRNQMQQVFLNLIYNAIQAMPDGGRLIIQTEVEKQDDKEWIVVKIMDSGQGIKQELLDQIFEPFFTTKPSGEGTGLGLSVSFGIVLDHGGVIEVESEEGKGSTFVVRLPVKTPIKLESEQVNV